MIKYADISNEIISSTGIWNAVHTSEPYQAPAAVEINGRNRIAGCGFHLDSIDAERALLEKVKAYRKSGAAVVEEHGRLPFGNQIRFFVTTRYASNHLRVTADFHWPRNTPVERHFGVGGLFLPGKWVEYRVVPPILHMEEGQKPKTVAIPELENSERSMIGHWHRPPLSLTFRDVAGMQIEVGTGMDVWRWEQCLGAGPESGSYKVFVEPDGVRLVREPLMCCTPFIPNVRPYRFKWYAAWNPVPLKPTALPAGLQRLVIGQAGKVDWKASQVTDDSPWLLDFNDIAWPDTARRDGHALGAGDDAGVCWQSSVVVRTARRIIRQIAACKPSGTLVVRGLDVGWCRDASHLDRGGADKMLRHWDIDGVLDLGVWARQQLGTDWIVHVDSDSVRQLPVMAGLFQINGFETEAAL